MDIVFRHIGQFVVDHLRQLLDIEPASRDLGGHQRGDLSALEHVQRFHPCRLALVAVDGRRLNA